MSLHVENAARATAIRDTFNATVDPGDARAYLREEAPEHLHVTDSPRFGDVILVAGEGANVAFRYNDSSPAGMHGWDPTLPSMGGIFLARGPTIAPGGRLPAFESIHIYPFLAEALELDPNPGIDGDPSVLRTLIGPRSIGTRP